MLACQAVGLWLHLHSCLWGPIAPVPSQGFHGGPQQSSPGPDVICRLEQATFLVCRSRLAVPDQSRDFVGWDLGSCCGKKPISIFGEHVATIPSLRLRYVESRVEAAAGQVSLHSDRRMRASVDLSMTAARNAGRQHRLEDEVSASRRLPPAPRLKRPVGDKPGKG